MAAPIIVALNEYGTPVTALTCETCGRPFTVCPEVPPDRLGQWRGCLAEDCASYDPMRDVDMFFDALSEHGLIVRGGASPR